MRILLEKQRLNILLALVLLFTTAAGAVDRMGDHVNNKKQEFLAQVEVRSMCNLERYFQRKTLIEVYEALNGKKTPIDESNNFQKFLVNWSKETLWEGLEQLKKINPKYSSLLMEVMTSTVQYIDCGHSYAKGNKGIAYAVKMRDIDDSVVNYQNYGASLLEIVKLYQQRSLYSKENSKASRKAKKIVFHEFLHTNSFKEKTLEHKDRVLESGAHSDVVYSCSNYSFPVFDLLYRGKTKRTEGLRAKSYIAFLDAYGSVFMPGLNHQSYKMKKSLRSEFNIFSYEQCLTCYAYANTRSKKSATQFCKKNAVKLVRD